MKRLLLSLLLSLTFISVASAQTTFVAFLVTGEEQLSNYASSLGYANFELSADHQRLDYQLVFWSIQDPSQAHIHVGARGVDGPPAKDLQIVQDRYARGTWSTTDDYQPLTPALIDSLFAGKLYVNVHTLLNPTGEIRGQIFQPQTYVALATGDQETPPVTSSGMGVAFCVLDPLDSVVFVRGQADGMTSKITAAHIHQGAPGVAGPVVKPTPMNLSAIDSLSAYTMLNWSPTDSNNILTPALLSQLETGSLYWNVHTVQNPLGEIRGQLRRQMLNDNDTGLWFMAILSGPQEGTVGKPSNGTGTAFIHLSSDGTTARIGAIVTDLDAPVVGAHIHHGSIGEVPGNNVVLPLPTSLAALWTSSDPTRPLTPADIDSLFAGTYYINVHTSTYPDGEIRGQFLPLSSRSELRLAVKHTAQMQPVSAAYPNPARGIVNLDISGQPKAVRVLNALGQVVDVLSVDEVRDGHIRWNASNVPNGTYLLSIESSNGTERVPVTVIR